MDYKIKIKGNEWSVHELLTILLAFSLSFHHRIAPILIILMFVNWAFTNDWKNYLQQLKASKSLLMPVLLFLLYCAGILFTANEAVGWFDLQVKLSLFVLPVIFISKPIPARSLKKIMNSFSTGCFLATIFCIAHSSYLYYEELGQVEAGVLRYAYTSLDFFFASNLSCFFHPSYFAMYLCMAIAYVLMIVTSASNVFPLRRRLLLTLLAVYFSIFIFFLASRMGMIVVALTWLYFGVWMIASRKLYLAGAAFFAVIISTSFILYSTSEIIASRFDYAVQSFFSKNIDKTSSESSAARILVWSAALEIVREHPFGVGTGEEEKVLTEKYAQKGMTYVYERKLNAHSQFLQTTIALGIAGGVFLVILLGWPLIVSLRSADFLLSFFVVNCILNFFVESMLEVQAGVVFFSFFYSLLVKR